MNTDGPGAGHIPEPSPDGLHERAKSDIRPSGPSDCHERVSDQAGGDRGVPTGPPLQDDEREPLQLAPRSAGTAVQALREERDGVPPGGLQDHGEDLRGPRRPDKGLRLRQITS